LASIQQNPNICTKRLNGLQTKGLAFTRNTRKTDLFKNKTACSSVDGLEKYFLCANSLLVHWQFPKNLRLAIPEKPAHMCVLLCAAVRLLCMYYWVPQRSRKSTKQLIVGFALVHMRDSVVTCSSVQRSSIIMVLLTSLSTFTLLPWLIHMCDMTHLHMQHYPSCDL